MLRRTRIALAITSAHGLACPLALHAQSLDEPTLIPITVTATRTERKLDDVPATVTVIPAREIEQSGARDIKDLLRNELDLSVRAAPTRFTAAGAATGRAGNEGINIRGLEGNQVLILVDGIRVPNAFSFGSFATGRGDFLNLDSAQSIEVLRGPASTQYGSDGLAGVISLRTLDPADVLKGRDGGGLVRGGYNSVDDSWATTLAAAGRSGAWQGLLLLNTRQGHETKNKGDNGALNSSRTEPNPVDYDTPAGLGKLLFTLNPQHRFGLTVDAQRRTQDTDVYSALAVPPLAATSAIGLTTHDKIDRTRVSIEHVYADPKGAWFQKAETRLYRQNAKVQQFATEDRNTAADRTRDNRYEQGVTGLSTLLESNFGGAVAHRVSYGLDVSRTDIDGTRDGTVAPFGETFPTRPFPDTRYVLAGAFVQDEIEAGALSVIPGLRFDSYKLEPSSDGYSGGEAVELSDHAVTPRLGLVWRLAPAIAPYAQWATGFRAPTPDQVNNGFTNLASGYRSVGNPNLKAEKANSVELGARGTAGAFKWQAAVFENRYRDFISQQSVSGSGTPADPTVFQYVNLSRARIHGAELRGEWRIDNRWTINGGTAWTRGETEANGSTLPLDTIEPWRAVLGLRYAAETFSLNATALHSAAQSAGRINPILVAPGVTAPAYATPAYTVLDLGGSWKSLPKLTLIANLNNVFDKTYWRWSDVRGLADSSTVKDAYTAPGRNLQVSARLDF